MNRNKLKTYAPAARREFIQAVTDRAHFWGLSEAGIEPMEESGDLAIIGGRPFPRAIAAKRHKLEEWILRESFPQVMEAIAYTWFNRFMALRYMEVNGFLEHGCRVLSNPGNGPVPEILDRAAEIVLPGLDKEKVIELKLDGGKDAELYRLLLVAQCNALHTAMPFLFERIDDETELLLPDSLLHSDSLIRKLVTEIDEEDWKEVEIIGWLYQFYISEKKDQVIGKVVKSEDIPAATQLFTPNWIVKYMVQNSLGRQWLATYPDSLLKAKMEYYIAPTEQADEVKAQLAAITPGSLEPENLTLLDPACGSGHILVEAYGVFKEIYLERGYSSGDFPRLILEKNLFGLDIDDRAAQMAGFALLMKARKDDRRILRSDNPVKLNVMAIQESGSIAIENARWGEHTNTLRDLVDLFRHGKTFGSLIQVPKGLATKLPIIRDVLQQAVATGDLYAFQNARELIPLTEQAVILEKQYDCVVANPPYMGSKGMNNAIKAFAKKYYEDCQSDTFAMFLSRSLSQANRNGYVAYVMPYVWMFLSTYERLRNKIFESSVLSSLIQLEYNAFEPACVPVATFILYKCSISDLLGDFIKLSDFKGHQIQAPKTLEAINNKDCSWRYRASSNDLAKIPGRPIAYWVKSSIRKLFYDNDSLDKYVVKITKGIFTGDNNRFIRHWHEVPCNDLKWRKYSKGGAVRKWYGNSIYKILWEDGNGELSKFKGAGLGAAKYYNRIHFVWSKLTSSDASFRYDDNDVYFDDCSPAIILQEVDYALLSYLNSKISSMLIKLINPTLNYQSGDIQKLPWSPGLFVKVKDVLVANGKECVKIAKMEWDSNETSWDFQTFPALATHIKSLIIENSWRNWQSNCTAQFNRMQELETQNNRIFIEAYGLQGELTPEVQEDQITLARTDRETDMKRLISYSIGCMMGRYSLDQPGLVYARSGNAGFDHEKYPNFPADDDGIIPVMDMEWFQDDAACRFEEFLKVAWSPEILEENLKFVADSFSPKGGETSRDTIRRYISTQFFKDHLQTYKKRPIYWLFSSGRQRAFECLVYLHRYNEVTLARMRNEYVTPLQGKFSAQADYFANEVNAATSTAERNRLQKRLDTLKKKKDELAAYDEQLRYFADQKISLNLDDGVRVNYGKFGNLLADVKVVTGAGE